MRPVLGRISGLDSWGENIQGLVWFKKTVSLNCPPYPASWWWMLGAGSPAPRGLRGRAGFSSQFSRLFPQSSALEPLALAQLKTAGWLRMCEKDQPACVSQTQPCWTFVPFCVFISAVGAIVQSSVPTGDKQRHWQSWQ